MKLRAFLLNKIGTLSYALACLIIVFSVFFILIKDQLSQLETLSNAHIDQAESRLFSQISSIKLLALNISRHPFINYRLDGSTANDINQLLKQSSLISGVRAISFRNFGGELLGSSLEGKLHTPSQEVILEANKGNLPREFGRHTNGVKYFAFTKSVIDESGFPIGYITVELDLAQLDFELTNDRRAILFANKQGMIVISDQETLVGAFIAPQGGLQKYSDKDNTLGISQLQMLSNNFWLASKEANLNRLNLVKFSDSTRLELKLISLQDAMPRVQQAIVQSLLLAALLALIGVVLKVGALRRENLADRLSVESELNHQLEARVAERTQELKSAQEQLIFAGKLSAMGQLSATITHELNQPLAATRNFAENGSKFLERGQEIQAKENFELITTQLDRISRIIKNLRAFAGKEDMTNEAVDLIAVINETLSLVSARLRGDDVAVELQNMPDNLWVIAGDVRLQQVLVNLILNAIDAMHSQLATKRIFISLELLGNNCVLIVRDTGPGLEKPDQVFEPFYSTKHANKTASSSSMTHSKIEQGLGLGLSISRDIVGSFGGSIKCENARQGGAIFTITLKLAQSADEAAQ